MFRIALCSCLAVLTVAFAPAHAGKQCTTSLYPLLAVDVQGSLAGTAGTATVKICISSKGTASVKGAGTTVNASGRTQTYKDNPIVELFFVSALNARSKYRVSASGKAKLTAKGNIL